jgi:hypothetical protein
MCSCVSQLIRLWVVSNLRAQYQPLDVFPKKKQLVSLHNGELQSAGELTFDKCMSGDTIEHTVQQLKATAVKAADVMAQHRPKLEL